MLTWGDAIPAGTKSILLSGGSNMAGVVDLEPYQEQIIELKQKYKINAHLGLLTYLPAYSLSSLLDVVSFDFPASERVILEVYHLDKTMADYIQSYQLLSEILPVEVHLTVGLEFGKVQGEFEVLKLLSELGVKQLVLNVFVPTAGTAMAELAAPPLSDVVKVFAKARELFKKVSLGCMRPAGKYREALDLGALDLGFDIIVQATTKVREEAQQRGLEIKEFDECCAFLLVEGG
ncbi:MAG: radical SAM protein [Candidatus Gracilibacteria bacterium]|nr:radical SAM protein [Candidatus Gracilibacteria bacterium]